MNARWPISRRAFLRRGAWLAIGGAASVAIAGTAARALGLGRAVTPGERLAAVITHKEGAVRVGQIVLAAGSVERDIRSLIAGLHEGVPELDDLLRDGGDADIRAALDAARRRDFAQGGDGVIRVERWVVARTEARVCGLMALVAVG